MSASMLSNPPASLLSGVLQASSGAALRPTSGGDDGSSTGSSTGHRTSHYGLHSSAARSRSPSASPGFNRRAPSPGQSRYGNIGQGSSQSQGHPYFPSHSPSLPTIPSSSNIADSINAEADVEDSSPWASGVTPISIIPKSRSTSLIPAPIGSGSPRENRMLERSGSATRRSPIPVGPTAFSSSVPTSSIWGFDIAGKADVRTALQIADKPAPSNKGLLSRHLSLSGNERITPSTSRAASLGPTIPEFTSLSRTSDPFIGGSPRATGEDVDREGRSRTRNAPLTHAQRVQQRTSGILGGIAQSNMSPFMRDAMGLPESSIHAAADETAGWQDGFAHRVGMLSASTDRPVRSRYSASFSASGDAFASRDQARQMLDTQNTPGFAEHVQQSSRTVGSGRLSFSQKPSGSALLEREEDALLTGNSGLEIEEYDDDDDAPPTRSGATSRRHSVAAFTTVASTGGSSGLVSPTIATRSQIGFFLPNDVLAMTSVTGRGSRAAGQVSGPSISTHMPASVSGPSVFDRTRTDPARLQEDDLLAADLNNALQLNLSRSISNTRPITFGSLGQQADRLPRTPTSEGFVNRPVQQGSPYGSVGMRNGPSAQGSRNGTNVNSGSPVAPSSPPTARPGRASSVSGDPYSPSASAARFVAVAQNVQPPPLPPQLQSYSRSRAEDNVKHSSQQINTSADPLVPGESWPAPASVALSNNLTSPYARGGRLPSPAEMQQYNSATAVPFVPRAIGPHQYMATASPNAFQLSQRPDPPRMPSGHSFSFERTQYMSHTRGGQEITMPTSPSSRHQPYYLPPIAPQPTVNELGRGVPLHALPSAGPLYIVEFKAGRTDLFYIDDPDAMQLQKGDLVVVEADRGKDLGKILTSCTLEEVREFQMHQVESALGQLAATAGGGPNIGGVTTLAPGQQPSTAVIARMTKEIHPKRIYGRASPADVSLLAVKAADEQKALSVCKAKVLQHQLPMEVTDAEFQFDRRRLTFFYISEHRIDFRNLVKDLFRLYKTRIWLCSVGDTSVQGQQ